MLIPGSRRLRVPAVVLVAVLTLVFLLYNSDHNVRRGHALDRLVRPQTWLKPHPPSLPGLPPEYAIPSSESPWCQDRYGTRYLNNTRDWSASYCTRESASNFTCFWSATASDRVDVMCLGRRAVFDASQQRFRLACQLRELSQQEKVDGVPAVPDQLTRHWYDTGPGIVMERAVLLGKAFPVPRKPATTTILVKREGNANLWHSLMEIISLSWTLDVLQMTVDDETGEPFLSPRAGRNAQVVLLDQHDEGNFIALWRLFAKMPIRHIHDLDDSEPPTDIVIPFAGGSNPLWQGDWVDLECHDSALVKAFVSRVLSHYNTSTPSRDADQVTVTFIHRTNTRKLIDEAEHIGALASAIPHMKLNVVDFAALPLTGQIDIIRGTDVLVGVHGAGLTHLMFLRPGSTVIEILPEGFQHKGFRNLAQMLGLNFLRTHAKMRGNASGSQQWQSDDVDIDGQKLMDVVGVGVRGLYSKDLRSHDVY